MPQKQKTTQKAAISKLFRCIFRVDVDLLLPDMPSRWSNPEEQGTLTSFATRRAALYSELNVTVQVIPAATFIIIITIGQLLHYIHN